VVNVKFGMSDHDLSREEKGVCFVVKNGTAKVGELVASKGGIRWYPKNSKKGHHFINWEQLGELLEANTNRKS
jgi:hypothetical protein